MSRLVELLERQLARPHMVTYGGLAHAAPIDPELLEELRKADDAAHDRDMRLHDLEEENARLRKRRKTGSGRAPAVATEAYARLGRALKPQGVSPDQIRAALIAVFRDAGNKNPTESAKRVMQKIDAG